MRRAIEYDEILRALRTGLGDAYDEKRFALESLAARIQEEVALYFRVQQLLEKVCDGTATGTDMELYILLSKHSASLTSMILSSTKLLRLEDKSKLSKIVEDLHKQLMKTGDNDDDKKEATTSTDNRG